MKENCMYCMHAVLMHPVKPCFDDKKKTALVCYCRLLEELIPACVVEDECENWLKDD